MMTARRAPGSLLLSSVGVVLLLCCRLPSVDAFVGRTAAGTVRRMPSIPQPLDETAAVTPSPATPLLVNRAARRSSSLSMVDLVSPEPIHTAFSVATFLPQPFWLLMILVPNAKITKTIMGGLEIPLLCALIHFFIVTASIVLGGSEATAPLAEFNDVFDPAGDPQRAFMGMTSQYPNFVAEEWSHVLTWDLFVGRYIWLDGLQRGIFTAPAVLFCNLIGPPGLLIHWLTCTVSGKAIFESNEKDAILALGDTDDEV